MQLLFLADHAWYLCIERPPAGLLATYIIRPHYGTYTRIHLHTIETANTALMSYLRLSRLSWWCSGSAALDSWLKDRWFDSRPGRYQVNWVNSGFHPSGVGKSISSVHGWGRRRGVRSLLSDGRCYPIWQVTSRSCEMGLPWRAISAFTLFLPFVTWRVWRHRIPTWISDHFTVL